MGLSPEEREPGSTIAPDETQPENPSPDQPAEPASPASPAVRHRRRPKVRAAAKPATREPTTPEPTTPEPTTPEAQAGEAAAPAPVRPTLGDRPQPVSPTDTFAAAGRKAMWLHVDRLLTREAALADVDHPDGLRRYRVAIRRLRAALRLFGEAYPRRDVKTLRRDLADLAQAVGTVRDLDLRIADLNRWALERGGPSPIAVEPLVATWAGERSRALAALLDRVGTRRHRRLLHDLVAFVDAPEEADRKTRFEGAHTVADRAGSRVWAAYEEVRAFSEIVRWADVDTLHGLRIATKRLRDDLEFLGGILGPTAAPLLERLVALQDHLGAMNDAAVTAGAVRSFLERRHAELEPDEQAEIARYLADREREVTRLRRSSVWPWRRVTAITFARRLARLVVLPAGRA